MKIIKRPSSDMPKEEAHGGSGKRKLYASREQLTSPHFEALTHGYLPGGNSFDWHEHQAVEEVMIVLKGRGKVHDADGEYDYAPGDVFVFPANTTHKISNNTDQEHEMIFMRVKV